jgi:hypothetical protein
MRTPQVWVQPFFGEVNEGHGLSRLRSPGLLNAISQGLLRAADRNRKRLLVTTRWGQCHAPCGSLLVLPAASRLLAATS